MVASPQSSAGSSPRQRRYRCKRGITTRRLALLVAPPHEVGCLQDRLWRTARACRSPPTASHARGVLQTESSSTPRRERTRRHIPCRPAEPRGGGRALVAIIHRSIEAAVPEQPVAGTTAVGTAFIANSAKAAAWSGRGSATGRAPDTETLAASAKSSPAQRSGVSGSVP